MTSTGLDMAFKILLAIGAILGTFAFCYAIWKNQSYSGMQNLVTQLKTELEISQGKNERLQSEYAEQRVAYQTLVDKMTVQSTEHKQTIDKMLSDYQKLQDDFKAYREKKHEEANRWNAIGLENAELKSLTGPVWVTQLRFQNDVLNQMQENTGLAQEMIATMNALIKELRHLGVVYTHPIASEMQTQQ